MAHITKKENGTYQIRVYSAGQQKAKTYRPPKGLTARQLDRAINDEAALLLQELVQEQERRLNPSQTLFLDFSQKWFNNYADKLRVSTQYGYNTARRRTEAYFAGYTLAQITPEAVTNFVSALQRGDLDYASPQRRNKTAGTLSIKTIRNHIGLLSSILSTAQEWGFITDNPVAHIKQPRLPHKSINVMTDNDLQKFISVLNKSNIETRALFFCELYTGLRRGELAGLQWPDVDFDAGTITVQRSVQYTPQAGTYVDELKSGTSYRTIYVPAEVLDLLQEYKSKQVEQASGVGWVFPAQNGGPVNPGLLYMKLRRFLHRNGLTHYSLHSLRHSHASLMIANGVDVKTVSCRLGHANVSTTTEIYATQVQRANKQAADKLADAFSALSSQKPAEE